jgi:hypothetical protein
MRDGQARMRKGQYYQLMATVQRGEASAQDPPAPIGNWSAIRIERSAGGEWLSRRKPPTG